MNIEDQVCSLELSKRLKELGIKQESYFIWAKNNLIPRLSIHNLDKHELFEPYICAAFTVAELGEMLPCSLQAETASRNNSILEINKNLNNHWLLAYAANPNLPPLICIIDDTEANARAKMLINLLEKN